MTLAGSPTSPLTAPADKAPSLELAGEKMSDSEIMSRLMGYLWPPGEGKRCPKNVGKGQNLWLYAVGSPLRSSIPL